VKLKDIEPSMDVSKSKGPLGVDRPDGGVKGSYVEEAEEKLDVAEGHDIE
jgi:hypothetical protein